MPKSTSPKCEFSADITLEQYIQGCLYHARLAGRLRNALGMLALGAVLLTGGMVALLQFLQRSYAYSLLWLSVLLGFLGIALPFVYLVANTSAVRKQAVADFKVFQKLMQPMTVRFYEDQVDTVSEHLTLHDQYALMARCMETRDFFLLIKDRDRFLLIPKDQLPDQKRAAMEEFLRMVFARRYRKMNSLIL